MKKTALLLFCTFILSGGVLSRGASPDYILFDVARGEKKGLVEMVPRLLRNQVIVVGEHHDRMEIHHAQLAIIRAVHESGARVAIGLEMFQAESQDDLDKWVRGDLSKEEFQEIYYRNWNFPWPFYSMILEYTREENIPLVGLNVPRETTRRVALEGFQSLSEEQKRRLPDVVCEVDPHYMDFIRRAYDAHAHSHLDFTYFCEAQLLWNEAMAAHAVGYLDNHPETIMVILTGMGHARKNGIPEEIGKRSDYPWTVILPEVPGVFEAGATDSKDGDYILLGLSSMGR